MSVEKNPGRYQINIRVKSLGGAIVLTETPEQCPYHGLQERPPGAHHAGDCGHCEMFMGVNSLGSAAAKVPGAHLPSSDAPRMRTDAACCWLKVGVAEDEAVEAV